MSVATIETEPGPGPRFFLSPSALRQLALDHRASYSGAKPYPYVILDGFLGDALARDLAARFPGPAHENWKRRDFEEQSARLGELQRRAFEGVDGGIRHLLAELSGMSFLDFLEKLTGVQGLIPDPHFRGAGLKLTLRGGHLGLHVDFNRDERRALSRRVTVLYYLNADWEPAWGGDLELWNADLSACEARIAPVLDRLVVLAHGETNWHGHPAPLSCPEDRGRAVITAYFYVAEPSQDAPEGHGALWAPQGKP